MKRWILVASLAAIAGCASHEPSTVVTQSSRPEVFASGGPEVSISAHPVLQVAAIQKPAPAPAPVDVEPKLQPKKHRHHHRKHPKATAEDALRQSLDTMSDKDFEKMMGESKGKDKHDDAPPVIGDDGSGSGDGGDAPPPTKTETTGGDGG